MNIEESDFFVETFGMSFESSLTREKFNEICSEIWQDMLVPVVDAIADVQNFWQEFSKDKIEKVVVVGGSTRIIKVRETLNDYFGEEKVYIHAFPE